jgi:hypothetical protein
VDSQVARAILRALSECWPEGAELQRAVIQERDPRRIVVTVWTSTPGPVVGQRGAIASDLKEQLGNAAPGKSVEFRVNTGARPVETEGALLEGQTLERSIPGRDLVPDLIGMTVGEAHAKARSSGFSIATGDPDGVPITFYMAHRQYAHWVVVAQSPLPGLLAPLHSEIVVAVEERGGGGEAGDREPRMPRPPGDLA